MASGYRFIVVVRAVATRALATWTFGRFWGDGIDEEADGEDAPGVC